MPQAVLALQTACKSGVMFPSGGATKLHVELNCVKAVWHDDETLERCESLRTPCSNTPCVGIFGCGGSHELEHAGAKAARNTTTAIKLRPAMARR
eukprot:CAMPEP_0172817722 /NCGR_PEP_ID=MMETSP1075-20121228/13420_1 /TAXON_ID=2916 /ORGANISM="Ceratium fusus, Strain PA161109" /LENGTH=94 /DNA_ID=CAMNT_0013657981 /DNA_START=623 /DNA_END=903 /DNA_ORIENTATION=-